MYRMYTLTLDFGFSQPLSWLFMVAEIRTLILNYILSHFNIAINTALNCLGHASSKSYIYRIIATPPVTNCLCGSAVSDDRYSSWISRTDYAHFSICHAVIYGVFHHTETTGPSMLSRLQCLLPKKLEATKNYSTMCSRNDRSGHPEAATMHGP